MVLNQIVNNLVTNSGSYHVFSNKHNILIKRQVYMYVPKRTMLGRAFGTMMTEGAPLMQQQVRGYATFALAQRGTSAKQHYPEKKFDAEGLEIMNTNDCSGHNHILMLEVSQKHKGSYDCLGSFTSSPSPYNGSKPMLINKAEQILGKKGYQYFHLYHPKKTIDTQGLQMLDADITYKVLNQEEYIKLKNTLIIDHNLDL